jgi:hypothetical protein
MKLRFPAYAVGPIRTLVVWACHCAVQVNWSIEDVPKTGGTQPYKRMMMRGDLRNGPMMSPGH